MASSSSDDEAEAVLKSVSNYHFVDDKEEPISFHVLPIQWGNENERQGGNESQLYLHGTADNGLQKIYKSVVAWKLELTNVKPEIVVFTKENNSITLQKPRKSYEGIIRSLLVTVHCLSYVKRNPQASGKALWDHLSKALGLFETRPSQNDLVDHMTLIDEAVKRDDALANSKFVLDFLREKPTRRKLSDEDIQGSIKPGFIVDDAEDDMIDVEDEAVDNDNDDGDNLFDSVCAFCDNGGELLCCEGRCLRSFHPTLEDGEDSICESLGFTQEEVNALPNFFCKNCQYKQHQCFACGKLGSSDKSSGAEVFPCVSATCGQFYHPRCVAQLIYRESGASAEEFEKKISLGGSFICPIHKCCVCKQVENKKVPELRFAVCRRCPKSYHRKCLPSDIHFEKTEDDEKEEVEEEEVETRAWEGLLPNRVLIYCTEHEIDEEIGTPIRNHVKFPYTDEEKTTFVKKKIVCEEKKRNRMSKPLEVRENFVLKKRKLSSEGLYRGSAAPKISKQKMTSGAKVAGSRTNEKVGFDVSRKAMANYTLKKEVNTSVGKKDSLGNMLFAYTKGSGSGKIKKHDTPDGDLKSVKTDPTSKALRSTLASLDPARERRLNALMKDAASSISLEEVISKHIVPSTHSSSNKYTVGKNITMGKVEGSVVAVRMALEKLKEGGSTEDAEAVCAPEILSQIYSWKNKLRIYLAPFLHGNRYSSFGRHFTKVEILEQIADRLHLHVENGDTIVDFCCGSNDFSIAMKNKLEKTGKKCNFKNFDIIQPKNDFCFERRDWTKVEPKELPSGDKLIMGLNPPFGVHASLANVFIKKALEFKPKILILILPPETLRLDLKTSPYDLIWEDDQITSGKAFYFPGSVDVNNKPIDQWNKTTPPLYLWCRRDLSKKHKAIAQNVLCSRSQTQQNDGHISMSPGSMEDGRSKSLDHSVENNGQYAEPSMVIDDDRLEPGSVKDSVSGLVASEGPKAKSSNRNDDKSFGVSSGCQKNQINESSARWQSGAREKHGRGMVELSPDKRKSGNCSGGVHKERSPSKSGRKGIQHSESVNFISSMPCGNSSGSDVHKERSPSTGSGGKGIQHSESLNFGSSKQLGTAYGGTLASETGRQFVPSSHEPYLSGTRSWSSGASPISSYMDANLEEPVMGHMRNRSDTLDYRPYSRGMEDPFGRESEIRAQLRRYGQQESDDFGSNYLARSDSVRGQVGSYLSSYDHGHQVSAVDSSYGMNMSAMQRYAPRLDELNHTRTRALGSQPALGYDPRTYSNMHEPRVPRPNDMHEPRVPRPNDGGGSFGFAPGPHPWLSNQNSAGWLDE